MPDPLPTEIQESWHAHLDGTLDASGADALLAWLDRHPHALSQLRGEAAVDAALSALLGPRIDGRRFVRSVMLRLGGREPNNTSSGFKRQVMTSVRKLRRRSSQPYRSGRPVVIACLALLVIGAVWFFGHAQRRSPAESASMQLVVERGSVSVDGAIVVGGKRLPVADGTKVALSYDARARVDLADGSRIALSDNASFEGMMAQDGGRYRLRAGTATVTAAEQTSGRHLEVITPHATVRVLGTLFTVQVDPAHSWIQVERGAVGVVSPHADLRLGANEQGLASTDGSAKALSASEFRVLPFSQARMNPMFDPALITETSQSYHGLPLRGFAYAPAPASHGFTSLEWPVRLAADETSYEFWIRPTLVQAADGQGEVYVSLVLAMDDCDYALPQMRLTAEETDWRLFSGELAQARLNWVRPGTQAPPLRADAVKWIMLRAYGGKLEAQVSAPLVVQAVESNEKN